MILKVTAMELLQCQELLRVQEQAADSCRRARDEAQDPQLRLHLEAAHQLHRSHLQRLAGRLGRLGGVAESAGERATQGAPDRG